MKTCVLSTLRPGLALYHMSGSKARGIFATGNWVNNVTVMKIEYDKYSDNIGLLIMACIASSIHYDQQWDYFI